MSLHFLARYVLTILLLIGFVGAPIAHAALTESQIQSILNLLQSFGAESSVLSNVNNALRGQSATTTGTTATTTTTTTTATTTTTVSSPFVFCPNLVRTLSSDDADATTGGAVSELQRFLRQDPLLYPEGLVTGFFGPATERAVQRFQVREGIVSFGSPDTTGYGAVGPATRARIARACQISSSSNTPIAGPFSITFPTAGAALMQGLTYNITWIGSNPGVSNYSMNLVGGTLGANGSRNLGNVSASQGYFSWGVPSDVTPGSGYQIQFSGAGTSGGNSPSFSIIPPPTQQTSSCPTTYSLVSLTPIASGTGTAGALGSATVVISGRNPGAFSISLSGALTGNASGATWNNHQGNVCQSLHVVPLSAGAQSGTAYVSLNFVGNIGSGNVTISSPPTSGSTTGATQSVVGFIGHVSPTTIYGWTCLQERASQLPVTVYFNGVYPTNVIANRVRFEARFLEDSRCSDIYHGFEIPVSSLGLPPGTYSVTASTQHPTTGQTVNLTQTSGQTTLIIPATSSTSRAVSLTVSPTSVAPGGTVTLSWNFTSGQPTGTNDWFGIYSTSEPANSTRYQPAWFYNSSATSINGNRTMVAPTTPGTYHVRYLLNGGYESAGISNIFIVGVPSPSSTGSVPVQQWQGRLDSVSSSLIYGWACRVGTSENLGVIVQVWNHPTIRSESSLARNSGVLLNVQPRADQRAIDVLCGSNRVASGFSINPTSQIPGLIQGVTYYATACIANSAGLCVEHLPYTAQNGFAIAGSASPTSGTTSVQPSVASISPPSGTIQAFQTTIFTVNGTGFDSNAKIQYSSNNGASWLDLATTYRSREALDFHWVGGVAQGTYLVRVQNPAALLPMNSNSVSYMINPAGTTGATTGGGATSASRAVNISVSPASVAPGGMVTVSWHFTAGLAGTNDWIAAYRTGEGARQYQPNWFYNTGAAQSGTRQMEVPSTAGSYFLRYLFDGGYDNIGGISNTFTVAQASATTAMPPVSNDFLVTGQSTNEAMAGEPFSMDIFGSGMVSGMVVEYSGTATDGVSPASVSGEFVTVLRNSGLVNVVTPSAGMRRGNYTLYLRHPATGRRSGTLFLNVNTRPPVTPSLSVINPSTINSGQQITFVITGSNFQRDSFIEYSGSYHGTILASQLEYVASSQLRWTTGATGLPTGAYNFAVRNPGSPSSNSLEVRVNAAPTPPPPPPAPTPVSCSVSPSTLSVNQTFSATASGGDGTYNWNVNTDGGSAVTGGSNLSVSFGTAGTKTIYVTSAGQTATCTVTVTAAQVPVNPPSGITYIEPSTISGNRANTTIDVVGRGFMSGAVIEYSYQGGPRLVITPTLVNSASVRLFAPNGLAAGSYRLWIKNPDGQSSTPVEGFPYTVTSPTSSLGGSNNLASTLNALNEALHKLQGALNGF